jgi:hypothetical protein
MANTSPLGASIFSPNSTNYQKIDRDENKPLGSVVVVTPDYCSNVVKIVLSPYFLLKILESKRDGEVAAESEESEYCSD